MLVYLDPKGLVAGGLVVAVSSTGCYGVKECPIIHVLSYAYIIHVCKTICTHRNTHICVHCIKLYIYIYIHIHRERERDREREREIERERERERETERDPRYNCLTRTPKYGTPTPH